MQTQYSEQTDPITDKKSKVTVMSVMVLGTYVGFTDIDMYLMQ